MRSWRSGSARPGPPFSRPLIHPSIAAAAGVGSGLPAGSQSFGPPAGLVTAQGVAPAFGIGQTFGALAGRIEADTYPAQVIVGTPFAYGPAAGQITGFGYVGVIGTSAPLPGPAVASFAPAISELGLDAWERVGVQANQLTTAHLTSMRRSMNLVLTRWTNRGINLWRVAQSTITLVPGQATYALDLTCIDMLDTYVSTVSGGISTDTIITPMSRNTYASLPNKLQAGRPVMYWFDRTISPTVTVWPVPDTSAPYTMTTFTYSQVQDADPASGNTLSIPYRFLEAFTAAIAAHLAMKFSPPDRAVALAGYANETFQESSDEDREKISVTIAPDLSPYFS
jgi:hypothetical protein